MEPGPPGSPGSLIRSPPGAPEPNPEPPRSPSFFEYVFENFSYPGASEPSRSPLEPPGAFPF